MSDAHGFQVVRGGFIPRPRAAQLGDFCAAPHNNRSSRGSTRRYVPTSFVVLKSAPRGYPLRSDLFSQPCYKSNEAMIHSLHPGPVEDLSPGTDEADTQVAGVTRSKNMETKTSAGRNPVAGGGGDGGDIEQSTRTSTTDAYTYTRTYATAYSTAYGHARIK